MVLPKNTLVNWNGPILNESAKTSKHKSSSQPSEARYAMKKKIKNWVEIITTFYTFESKDPNALLAERTKAKRFHSRELRIGSSSQLESVALVEKHRRRTFTKEMIL
ncbi:hypothetical protein DID88_008037 [Monilinia fructigena]|uniref:Uncharacterized protein n=1 Tax=Monilinia fructigena TaxID=38457 RepID=A0A395J6I3_9HELO|nr:hypothetical protein DID88_008037 [Monilinia fructigena]